MEGGVEEGGRHHSAPGENSVQPVDVVPPHAAVGYLCTHDGGKMFRFKKTDFVDKIEKF